MTAASIQAQAPSPAGRPAHRTIGFWMSLPLGLLQGVNALRVLADPAGFAAYMGLPLASPADGSWVLVYGSRTAFIAALVTIFVLRRDLQALKWTALAALVMPLCDALLAAQAGAPAATIVRHGLIALYLLVTVVMLWVAARRPASA
jgi:hypothetical protein